MRAQEFIAESVDFAQMQPQQIVAVAQDAFAQLYPGVKLYGRSVVEGVGLTTHKGGEGSASAFAGSDTRRGAFYLTVNAYAEGDAMIVVIEDATAGEYKGAATAIIRALFEAGERLYKTQSRELVVNDNANQEAWSTIADRVGAEINENLNEGWKEKVAAGALGAAMALGGQQFYQQYTQSAQTQQQQQLTPKEILIQAAKADGMTGNELAQFLAQAAHETLNFTRMREAGTPEYFTKKYELHKKTARILGNRVKGDGERYKGRGYIQLTGRDNYTRAGKALGLPLVANPELAADPETAAKIAIWYWNTRVAPKVSNFANTKAVTKKINPAMKHQQRRQQQFTKYQVAYNNESV